MSLPKRSVTVSGTAAPSSGRRPTAASAGADAVVLHDPLLVQDGGFHLRLDGDAIPLLMQGKVVPCFLPGWRASHLYMGFAPLFLLELLHDDGRTATWFLDWRMHHMGDSVDQLTTELVDLLRHKAVPILDRLLHTTLRQCNPVLLEESRAFLSLNETTRRAIAMNCLELLLRPPAIFLAQHLMPSSLLFRDHNNVRRAISRAHLLAGLADEFQDRLPRAFEDGVLTWPSPVDGTALRAQGSFCFDDFHFAYRFADARHGLVFFVMAADHYARICGMWFPSFGLMVSRDETARTVARQIARHLPYWFVTHSCIWAEQLVPYLRRGARRFASVLRGRPGVHIGHQLWNELSGIDHLLEGGAKSLPHWVVLNASDGIELYGALDELFPALKNRVVRDLADVRAMIRYAYAEGVMIVRVTREHVSRSLRTRILERVRASDLYREVQDQIEQARHAWTSGQHAAPVILLGLRVENRTLVDLTDFFRNLVGFIMTQFPGAIVVLDGHNARGDAAGRFIESHAESYARSRPIDIEHALAADLRRHFRDRPITIADTIGRPVYLSLAWADRCGCFVSIWGASLAKYRWVCNKTGLVISSRDNLLHRGDLHIYDAPRTMEAPSRLRFIDPDAVTDRPDVPLLVDVVPGNASFFNFQVDEARLFPQVREMIEQSLSGG